MTWNFWSIIFTFECDLGMINVNQQAKYLDQRSLHSRVTAKIHAHTHIHWFDCSIWTTKVVGKIGNEIYGQSSCEA